MAMQLYKFGWNLCNSKETALNIQYNSGGFSKSPPPRTGGVDFLAHRGSSWYPTLIPSATDFSSTAFPPSSLRKTTNLPVQLRGEQKFILASSQWKISDVRMTDSSEFSEFTWGGNRNLYFAYASFGWFATE